MLVGRGISPPGDDAEGAPPEALQIPFRTWACATLFLFFSAGFYFYWVAFPVVNTQFVEGHPRLGAELPGPYLSARYGVEWIALVVVAFWNGLVCMSFGMALAHNRLKEWAHIHKLACVIAMVVNLLALALFTVLWIGWCNHGYSGSATACNSALWCCVYWGDAWCPNGAPCAFPVSSGDLHRNPEATQHWAFCFVFGFFAFLHLLYNTTLRRTYGVLLA